MYHVFVEYNDRAKEVYSGSLYSVREWIQKQTFFKLPTLWVVQKTETGTRTMTAAQFLEDGGIFAHTIHIP